MKRPKVFATEALVDTTSRRLLITPSYFFLIWRWSMWLYALTVILYNYLHLPQDYRQNQMLPSSYYEALAIILLAVTLVQTLIATLYAPVLHILFPRLLRRKNRAASMPQKRPLRRGITSDENNDELIPFVSSHNRNWNVVVYGLDVLVCGLVTYLSATFSAPFFGVGSFFYRYGLSTVLAAVSGYGYRGGLMAAIGYDLFAVLGLIVPAPGTDRNYIYTNLHIVDILGSVFDAPIIAIIAGYLVNLIKKYAISTQRESYNARLQRSLVNVGQTLLQGTHDRYELLQRSAQQILQGGFFERIIITLVATSEREEVNQKQAPEKGIVIEAQQSAQDLPDDYEDIAGQVLQTQQRYSIFQPYNSDTKSGFGLARFYIPLAKDGQIHIILGAESRRASPFGEQQEKFLEIAGSQLLIAFENIRLTEQMIQLAASAERGRIAREIHDGIAQLVYMLSLHAETCQVQAARLAGASKESEELIAPLAERLGKLVTISKQALWETRNYMFSLKPLLTGATTITQTLTNQLREFESISDLPTTIETIGAEEQLASEKRLEQRYAQVGTALFRMLQEALTNIYKHARATRVHVQLQFLPDRISLKICDNGHGFSQTNALPDDSSSMASIYSGRGIRGMQERATELGGKISIHSYHTDGTVVSIELPL